MILRVIAHGSQVPGVLHSWIHLDSTLEFIVDDTDCSGLLLYDSFDRVANTIGKHELISQSNRAFEDLNYLAKTKYTG